MTDTPFPAPQPLLAELIDRHGFGVTLRALLRALAQHRRARRRTRLAAADLSDHLRRDIGLSEQHVPPPRLRGPLM